MNINNTTYSTTDDLINKLQNLKGKTKFKNYIKISNYHDEMNIRILKFEENLFRKMFKVLVKVIMKCYC